MPGVMTIFWRYIFIFVTIMIKVSTGHNEIAEFADRIMFTNKLESHTGCCLSRDRCKNLCCLNPYCSSFFYNQYNGRCQLHTEIFIDALSAYYSNGSRYYKCGKDLCTDDWYPYNGHCYTVKHNLTDWATAMNLCTVIGGYLATITTKNENIFIANLIGPLKETREHGYWLGGSDTVTEGTWQWDSTNEIFDLNNWNTNEPNNSGGVEDCLHIQKNGVKWNDKRCDYQEFGFICEKEYQGTEENCCRSK